MAHQPIPHLSPREQQESIQGSHSPARRLQSAGPAHVRLSLAVDTAVLREQMRTDLDLDAFLDRIVKHARALTGSNGAAVALRQGTVILCRARSGETSPSLGAQLDGDSGISGECLRSGKALRCEDSQTDPRLDPEVCRQLGLRSIAVVPIFESATVAGILEVFASQPGAFDDRHLEILQQLAELVTAASARVAQENQDTISGGILALRSEARREIAVAEVKSYASPSLSERLRKWTAPIALRRYYVAGIAILGLACLLTILGWKLWHRTEPSVALSTKTLPVAETEPASAATMDTRFGVNIPERGAAGGNVTSSYAAPSDHSAKVEAQRVDRVQSVTGTHQVKNIIVVPPIPSQPRDRVGFTDTAETLAPAPMIGATGGFGKDAEVVDSALTVKLNPPLMASQGVTGGSLQREVQPIYPPEARSARLQGSVVLQVVIDEGGEVQNLRIESGDAVLARAAIDAVRQWRYQPYRLNGEPVKMPIQITINFTLPTADNQRELSQPAHRQADR